MENQKIVVAALLVTIPILLYFIIKLYLFVDVFFIKIMHKKRPPEKRDARRTFTKAERVEASKICMWRCEGTGFFRCEYTGSQLQGDHWYPHAHGGATTIQNIVMLCPRCNRRKSAKIPTSLQTYFLKRRRRKGNCYEHSRVVDVGEWLPKSYVNSSSKSSKPWDKNGIVSI